MKIARATLEKLNRRSISNPGLVLAQNRKVGRVDRSLLARHLTLASQASSRLPCYPRVLARMVASIFLLGSPAPHDARLIPDAAQPDAGHAR
jgi:hypothetical protein